jgi:microcystin degradation protein MlrC
MAARYHVAIVTMRSENSTFSPFTTALADFKPERSEARLREHYREHLDAQPGQRLDLDEQQPPLDRGFDDLDFSFIFKGQATPGGPIQADAYAQMKAWITDGVAAAHAARPLDGLWFDLHGAMFAEGVEDLEGDILAAVRAIVGQSPMISVSFDLHGNMSTRIVAAIDMCTAFRTAPHIDEYETELKALTMLARCLRSGERPGLAYVKVPLAISGEMSNTADEPTKALYGATLHAADAKGAPGVMDASVLIGYCWADEPRSGGSVLVCGTDAEACEAEALRIAEFWWERRAEFRFGVEAGTPEQIAERTKEEVAKAQAAGLSPADALVIISDSGDNPTGGGVGDTPSMLATLLEAGVGDAVMQGPVDAAAVDACLVAGVGATVSLEIGGKLDYLNAVPLAIEATVYSVHPEETQYEAFHPTDTAPRTNTMPPAAVIAVTPPSPPAGSGGDDDAAAPKPNLVTLTSARKPFHYESSFAELGIEISEHPILVVKMGKQALCKLSDYFGMHASQPFWREH